MDKLKIGGILVEFRKNNFAGGAPGHPVAPGKSGEKWWVAATKIGVNIGPKIREISEKD